MALNPPSPQAPSLNALRVLEAAARHESFSRAANELFVTPAAVAQQVKRIEVWAGQSLFDRHTHGVRLNEAGRRALPALSAAFDSLGTAIDALQPTGADRTIVRIAALPAIAQLWLTPRLPDLRRFLPDVTISVTALETPPNLQREHFDFALFYVDPLEATGAVTRIADDTLFPVCSPSLAAANLSPGDLGTVALLHDTTWENDWSRWLTSSGNSSIDATAGPRFSLYAMALQAATDGDGVLMGRQTLIAGLIENGQLVAPFDHTVAADDRLCLMTSDATTSDEFLMSIAEWFENSAGEPA